MRQTKRTDDLEQLTGSVASFYQALCEVFGKDKVGWAYADKITAPGLFIAFQVSNNDFDKDLEGTINNIITDYQIGIWHDTMLQVLNETSRLLQAIDGTIFQVQSIRPAYQDGNKRKWHQDVTIRVMEDFQ